jgi:lysophospholipase L1-like esterase
MRRCSGFLVVLFGVVATSASAQEPTSWRFDFRPDAPKLEGSSVVAPGDAYTDERGYGLESAAEGGDAKFSVRVPEGNYRVTATLMGGDTDATASIYAEVRRLLAHKLAVPAGQSVTFTALVSVRTPRIAEGRVVRLKDRERTDEWANWDEKLTLAISGGAGLAELQIDRDDNSPTLFLIGDSTVSDQAIPPWNSWGQMLPRFFGPTIAVANHAESGESIRSALGERRFEKLYGQLERGDWVAVQFGHNDMKSTAADALAIYTADLETIVAEVRKRGATAVLITSMERKNGVERDTLAGYPDAVRAVAAKLDAPLVDLHALSRRLYRGLGDQLDAAFQDGTHHNDFGSYELARCVVEGLRTAAPELAKHLAADAGQFDPDHPDSPADWGVATEAAAH